MRDLQTYRAERRNTIRDASNIRQWRNGPFHAICERLKKPPLGKMFKTWTFVHASYGRAK